jgi:sphingosine kinase
MSNILYRSPLFGLDLNLDRGATQIPSNNQSEGILDRDSLTWQVEGRSQSLYLDDTIGAFPALDRHPYGFVINTYPLGSQKRRQLQQYYFAANSLEERNTWLEAIELCLRNTKTKPRPRLQIFLNPASGRKKAQKIWQLVAPVFEHSYCEFNLRETKRAGELSEIIKDLELDRLDGLVIIGGDGTIYEALNGLLRRFEGKEEIKMTPMGVIPGGTSNGLAKSILEKAGEPYDPVSAAFLIAKGKIGAIDLAIVRQQDIKVLPDRRISPDDNNPKYSKYYSILSFAWGLVSDVDLESDRLRFLGTLKTDLYVFIRLLFLRIYRGKLSLTEMTGETIEIDTDFVLLWAMNVPWAAYNLYTAPHATLADGTIDLLIIRGGASRWQILRAFLQMGKGKHIELPYVEYHKVRGFRLEPDGNRGVLAIDGEGIPCLPTTIEIHQGLGRIFGA